MPSGEYTFQSDPLFITVDSLQWKIIWKFVRNYEWVHIILVSFSSFKSPFLEECTHPTVDD